MARLDDRAAWLLAAVLALTALIGFGRGLDTALKAPRPEQVEAGVDPSRDPVPNAAALGGPALDEARVRQIAHEEAVAALGAPAKKKAAPVAKADDDADDAAPPHPAAATSEPSAPAAPAPAATPAAAPAPATPG